MRSFTTCNSYQYLGYHAKEEVDGACGTYGEEDKCTRDLVGIPKGQRPLAAPRPRLEDNIKKDLKETGWK
jgi:hypothetical protein